MDSDDENIARSNQLAVDVATIDVATIDVAAIDNKVLRRAVARVKQSLDVQPHTAYHTRHGSHKSYSKAW